MIQFFPNKKILSLSLYLFRSQINGAIDINFYSTFFLSSSWGVTLLVCMKWDFYYFYFSPKETHANQNIVNNPLILLNRESLSPSHSLSFIVFVAIVIHSQEGSMRKKFQIFLRNHAYKWDCIMLQWLEFIGAVSPFLRMHSTSFFMHFSSSYSSTNRLWIIAQNPEHNAEGFYL